MAFFIKKVTGQIEPFDVAKLKRSLIAPGASPELAEKIIDYIKNNLEKFQTTDDIYKFAFNRLLEENPHVAARYSLKKALLQFGPTGFPFEKFVAEIMKAEGYQVKLDQIVTGWCVDHEVDLIFVRDNKTGLIECKFHNEQFYLTNVQVPLYTQARFEDIKKTWKPSRPGEELVNSWIFTNTKFTFESIKYANCSNIRLTSWDYPGQESLPYLVAKHKVYPITVLTSLSLQEKKLLIENNIILCSDVHRYENKLRELRIKNLNRVLDEACIP